MTEPVNPNDALRESLVAAGAVVLEGTNVPPRSHVAGVPANVRREFTDDEVAANRRNAETYLMLAAEHGSITLAKTLVESNRAQLELADDAGFTALIYACRRQRSGPGPVGTQLRPARAAQRQHRAEGLELAQLARCRAIGGHHHLMPMRHLRAMQDARLLQGQRIGPDRVVIGRHHGNRAIRNHPVQIVPCHRRAQNLIRGPLRHQQRAVGMFLRIGGKGGLQRIERGVIARDTRRV